MYIYTYTHSGKWGFLEFKKIQKKIFYTKKFFIFIKNIQHYRNFLYFKD